MVNSAGRLGHANATITINTYAQTTPSGDLEAAEAVGEVLRAGGGMGRSADRPAILAGKCEGPSIAEGPSSGLSRCIFW